MQGGRGQKGGVFAASPGVHLYCPPRGAWVVGLGPSTAQGCAEARPWVVASVIRGVQGSPPADGPLLMGCAVPGPGRAGGRFGEIACARCLGPGGREQPYATAARGLSGLGLHPHHLSQPPWTCPPSWNPLQKTALTALCRPFAQKCTLTRSPPTLCLVSCANRSASALRQLRWAVMIALNVAIQTATNTGFSAVAVMLTSVSAESSGRIFGLAQTCAAAVRIVSPLVAGFLFSWTLNNRRPWPLNYHFTFYTIAGLCIGAVGLALLLPASEGRLAKKF